MTRKLALILIALVLAVVFFHARILSGMGAYLVHAEPPKQADIALVLAGDPLGNRILRGAELVRQGYVPKVLVSGPGPIYGLYECDLEIPFAVRAGYPASYFIHFEHMAHSTQEEAVYAAAELKKLGVKHVLLVTSNFPHAPVGEDLSQGGAGHQFYIDRRA